MQSNFTLKKTRQLFRLTPLLILFCLIGGTTKAQIITLSTQTDPTYNGLNTFGAVNSAVTFVIQNTNGFPVTLTDVGCYFDPGAIGGTSTTPTLWYSTTSLSGAPTISGPAWTSLVTGASVSFPSAGYYNVLSGLSFSIPGGTTIRFALQGSTGLSYSGGGTGVPAINTFSSNGVNFQVGNVLIGGLNVGYAGSFPAPTFNPRYFTGRVTINVSAAPCSGTPAPGNTLSSANPVCPTIGFNLSLQNPTVGSGVTYQWQSGPSAAGPWTNVGPNSPTYSTSQTVATFYQCIVTCGANSGTSTPVSVAMNPASSCYCIPGASDCTDDDMITRVRLSTLDNSSTCGTGPPAGYTNYTGTVTAPTVYSGAANPIIINKPAVWTEGVVIWIDYNQNGTFDAAEATSLGTAPGTAASLSGNINIPASALPGTTRMRIRMNFAAIPTSPCAAMTFGETEDYNVNIVPCVPVTITSPPANVSTVCGGNASFTVATNGSLPAYSWQYRTSAAGVWQTVTAAAPHTAVTGLTSATLAFTNIPATLNGYQFRALVTGGCSAVDFSSPPATLTVTAIVPVVNPASATICLGSVQQLSLTNSVSAPTTAIFNASAGLPLNIPDNSTTGVTNVVAVSGIPAGAVITNVGIRFTMTHTWVGDVVMNLKGANGQTLNLVAALDGGAGSNGTANFTNTVVDSISTAALSGAPAPRTGNFRADKFTATIPTVAPTTTNSWLPLLGGSGVNGNWTLGICDIGPADLGILTAWSVSITYVSPVLAQGTWTGPAGTMYLDAGLTAPYTGTPATTIYVNPTVSSNYQVSFTTPTPCTSATTTVPVTVVNPISAVVNPVNRTVCVGGSTTFTTSAAGGPITYQWQVSSDGGLTYSNISGATASTYNLSGITQSMNGYRYRAVLSAAPCAGSTTTTAATLTVNALPIVTLSSPDLLLTPGQTTSITASSSPAAAAGGWVWNYNGSTIVGNTTNTVSGIDIDEAGTYHATVTDVNGCVNTSADIVIGAEASDHLWIYPNPNDGVFQVRYYYDPSSVAELRGVYIYNAQGQLVESREFALTNAAPYVRMDFDLSRQSRGTYVVKVVHKHTGKIVSGLVVKQ